MARVAELEAKLRVCQLNHSQQPPPQQHAHQQQQQYRHQQPQQLSQQLSQLSRQQQQQTASDQRQKLMEIFARGKTQSVEQYRQQYDARVSDTRFLMQQGFGAVTTHTAVFLATYSSYYS